LAEPPKASLQSPKGLLPQVLEEPLKALAQPPMASLQSLKGTLPQALAEPLKGLAEPAKASPNPKVPLPRALAEPPTASPRIPERPPLRTLAEPPKAPAARNGSCGPVHQPKMAGHAPPRPQGLPQPPRAMRLAPTPMCSLKQDSSMAPAGLAPRLPRALPTVPAVHCH